MTTVTQAEYARHLDRDRSYVTRLKQKGRLVMVGLRVDVEKSDALVEATKDERHSAVADRHAAERARKRAAAAAPPKPQDDPEDLMGPDAAVSDEELSTARRTKALAEARRTVALADQEEMTRDKLAGSLVAREDVDFILDDFGATLRSNLETLADRLAPVVYPLKTLEETHAAITDAAEGLLTDISELMDRRVGELTQ